MYYSIDMINIALLEDDKIQLNVLYKKVNDLLKKKELVFNIDTYLTSASLNDVLINKKYDIYILDIRLDEKGNTSLSLATKINNLSEDSQIIFITSYEGYFKDVYICKHTYCLLKDEIDLRLNDALNSALINLSNKKTVNIIVKAKHNVSIIKASDILYLEKSLRKIKFILKDKNIIETYASFDDYIDKLPEYFLLVHRSFIVNMNYVKSIEGNNLILLNNESIPISRTHQKDIMNKLFDKYFN